MQRSYNRGHNEIRPLHIITDFCQYAEGSVLLTQGKTKILCTVSMASGVPHFLRGTKKGWLTASYALLPHSTQIRTERESVSKRHDRSVEISRLIGRVLRAVVNLESISEQTVYVDCDVVQADGGTRTAALTAASIALQIAENRWLLEKKIEKPFLQEAVVGISVGLINGNPLLDLDYQEDSQTQADVNFVFGKSGNLVEIQGTAEQGPISWQMLDAMRIFAQQGASTIFEKIEDQMPKQGLFSFDKQLQPDGVAE